MNRFLKFTTQEEPAITIGVIAAALLYLVSKFVFLSDDDLAVAGPILVMVISGIIRQGVFSPASVARLTSEGKDEPKE
jgi:hypothetical protein